MPMASEPRSVRNPWWVVFGAFLATSFGAGPVMVSTFGVFIKPVSQTFGWERSVMSSALMVATLLNAAATPGVGLLIDRFGVRLVAIPAILLFSLTAASMSLLNGDRLLLFVLFGLWGFLSAGHAQVPYVTAIYRHFERRRGLALSLGLSGVALGAAVLPALTTFLIGRFGWREAYLLLGGLTAAVAGLAVAVFIFPTPVAAGAVTRSDGDREDVGRAIVAISLLRVMRTSATFWLLVFAIFLIGFAMTGLSGHIVPLLTDRGVSPFRAAGIAGVIGISAIFGRIVSGYMADRIHPPYVAALFYGAPLPGIALLQFGGSATGALVPAMVFIGMAVGAEADIAGVLVGRYFRVAEFGRVFACAALAFSLGVGLGPLAMSLCYDATHSYDLAIVAVAVSVLMSAALISQVGRRGTIRL